MKRSGRKQQSQVKLIENDLKSLESLDYSIRGINEAGAKIKQVLKALLLHSVFAECSSVPHQMIHLPADFFGYRGGIRCP